MKQRVTAMLCSIALSGALVLSASPISRQNSASTAPDNTKVNKNDQKSSTPTADQAKNNMSDLQIMRHIRQDVVKDKSLSTYAHNVKIVATHGKVTLRGPVHSEDEKKAIEEHAKKYAADGDVTNNLTVKGDSK